MPSGVISNLILRMRTIARPSKKIETVKPTYTQLWRPRGLVSAATKKQTAHTGSRQIVKYAAGRAANVAGNIFARADGYPRMYGLLNTYPHCSRAYGIRKPRRDARLLGADWAVRLRLVALVAAVGIGQRFRISFHNADAERPSLGGKL